MQTENAMFDVWKRGTPKAVDGAIFLGKKKSLRKICLLQLMSQFAIPSLDIVTIMCLTKLTGW